MVTVTVDREAGHMFRNDQMFGNSGSMEMLCDHGPVEHLNM